MMPDRYAWVAAFFYGCGMTDGSGDHRAAASVFAKRFETSQRGLDFGYNDVRDAWLSYVLEVGHE